MLRVRREPLQFADAAACLQAWRDKYNFNLWRPIIGIRNANLDDEEGTAPFQQKDWTQLGAPKTNQKLPGVQPGFPAYPSGHATIGTSSFWLTKIFLDIPDNPDGKNSRYVYNMKSDEYNGINTGRDGKPRDKKKLVRKLSIEQAIEENKRSRVFLGVHWNIDSTGGGDLGTALAEEIVKSFPKKAS
jgi:PAP2 superfamily